MITRKPIGILVAMVAVLTLFASCEKSGDEPAKTPLATLVAPTVNCFATTDKIDTDGDAGLTFEATIEAGDTPWVSFSASGQTTERVGSVGDPIYLYMQANYTDADRTAIIEVRYSDAAGSVVYSVDLSLTQTAYLSSADYDRQWAEQPGFKPAQNIVYKTYFTTLNNGKYVRNYSICYDMGKRIAHWVAYPHHRTYTNPNTGRTDEWGYDPNDRMPEIPFDAQQYIAETYGTGHARGHQLPSADRYSNDATNIQTFYATNMMPQNGSFNSGVWARLEGYVRTNMNAMSRDTLYVVTGTYFGDGRTIQDKRGHTIAVPSHCWKVLLRTESGDLNKPVEECTADELIGIGFWFSNDLSNGSVEEAAVSIADIEERTGFSFFHNLPDDVAAAVKAQENYGDWHGFY